MTMSQTRQSVTEWARSLLQGKTDPADKAKRLADKETELLNARKEAIDSQPLTVIERELAAVRQAKEQLAPELEAAEKAAYDAKLKQWEVGWQAIMAQIGEPLGEIEALLDKAAEHDANHPTPPPGKRFWGNKSSEKFALRDALVSLGEATRLYSRGGTGYRPTLGPRREIRIQEIGGSK